jgi:putative MATE family efflux protein
MDTRPQEKYTKRDLSSGSLTQNLIMMSVPIAANMALQSLYSVIDVWWLGRYSKEAMASVGATGALSWLVASMAIGFGTAGTALVAQYTGAKRQRDADHVAGQVMMFMTALGAILAVPMIVYAPQVLAAFAIPKEMLPQAVPFLRMIMIAMPAALYMAAYGSILRALGDTHTILIVGVVVNVINMAIDPLFIFGWHPIGMPRLGAAGAGMATGISQVVGALYCYRLLRKHKAGLYIDTADYRPDPPALRKVFSIGLPAAINNAGGAMGFALFQTLINGLGTTVVAAYTVGFRIINFVQIPSQSIGMAAQPIVGQALGADNPKLARKTIKLCTNAVALTTLPAVFLLMWQGQHVARFFTPDRDVIAESRTFFLIVPISTYFFGLIMVLNSAFTGSGHTKPVMVLTIVRMWVLRLPVAYGLTHWGFGAPGVYWGMVAGNVICVALTFQIFRRGKWQIPVISTKRRAEGLPAEEVTELTSAD